MILDTRVSHPTDSHPTIAVRLEALGVKHSSIDKESLLVPSESAIDLIDGAANIEEELTMLEHRLMVALGRVELPDECEDPSYQNALLQVSYFLAAVMVTADNKVNGQEMAIAEGPENKIFDDFDLVEFRGIVSRPEEIPDIPKLLSFVGELLT